MITYDNPRCVYYESQRQVQNAAVGCELVIAWISVPWFLLLILHFQVLGLGFRVGSLFVAERTCVLVICM